MTVVQEDEAKFRHITRQNKVDVWKAVLRTALHLLKELGVDEVHCAGAGGPVQNLLDEEGSKKGDRREVRQFIGFFVLSLSR